LNSCLRDKKCQAENKQKEIKDPLPEGDGIPNAAIYDTTEDPSGYQELGELSQPSHYDKLK
jgi:hypothetical protein